MLGGVEELLLWNLSLYVLLPKNLFRIHVAICCLALILHVEIVNVPLSPVDLV